jgi:ABC-type antimicrobial peptide transport system permease subunit
MESDEKKLSEEVLLYKVSVLICFTFFIFIFIIAVLKSRLDIFLDISSILLSVFITLIIFSNLYYCLRIKKIYFHNGLIYVSNFWGKAVVPLSNIRGVEKRKTLLVRPMNYALIVFKKKIKYGDSVIFWPKDDCLEFLENAIRGVSSNGAIDRNKA